MLVLTADNMKKAEEAAVQNGCSYYELMKTAGTKCADAVAEEYKNKKVVILCGKGRNGGDGFVIASRLRQRGFKNVFVILVYSMPSDELCIRMYDEMIRYPVVVSDFSKEPEACIYHISTADVLTDAIFGIGFRGSLSGNAFEAVKAANDNKNARKYAVDIPSGLSADGDNADCMHFEADETFTMIAMKPVQVMKPDSLLCGKTTVMDIGVGNDILEPFAEEYTAITRDEAYANIKQRAYDSHKGSFGHILTICGSRNMSGCVYLCNQAAVEIGAGLVTAAFPSCIYNAVAAKLNEPLMLPTDENGEGRIRLNPAQLKKALDKADAVAIGCGLGVDNDTRDLVRFVIENFSGRLILDADALNCVAKNPDILKNAAAEIIITPHPGEMSRLTGLSVAEIQNNRIKTASDFAEKYGVTVVLKGADTVIADKNSGVCINTTGNPSMARGGSGDVLTGIIAGLTMQTADAFTAACAACCIHGDAADRVVMKYGSLAATPTRVVENLNI